MEVPMQIGYARSSTVDQEAGFQAQIKSLKSVGCEKVFARSVSHLVAIGERLEAKGVALRVLDQAIDTSNSTGRLMFNMLGAIAQFERELMLERQREGIAKAKAEGKYRGRAPTARAKAPEIRRLRGEGIGPTEIAKRLRISRASVYRALP
jgi:DNA invertase Pin-like site-specific DNA recombinase